MGFQFGETVQVSSAVQVASKFLRENSGRINPVQGDPRKSIGDLPIQDDDEPFNPPPVVRTRPKVKVDVVYAQDLAATLFPDQAMLGEWSGLVISACSWYSPEWVCEAMRCAASAMESKRKRRCELTWRYIEAILRNWKDRGYSDEDYRIDRNGKRSSAESIKKAVDFVESSKPSPDSSNRSLQQFSIREKTLASLMEKRSAGELEFSKSVADIKSMIESGFDPINDIASRVFVGKTAR